MIKAEKKQMVKELVKEFGEVDNFYFADFTGINAEDVTRLRSQLRAEKAYMKVVKNRLLARILKQLDVEISDPDVLRGPTAVLYSQEDILVPARKVDEFATNEVPIRFKGAFIEGRFLNEAGVEKLAKIPSRDGLLSQMLGVFEGMKSAMVMTLKAKLNELILVLGSLRDHKEEE
ncbi:50S ribosomal protein L10 [candidate division WOR-3 bacterium]|uniref:Large ribosomal subunit protein uL10 n=1 Tax=candidate division WOR-3 bacterium TaxID=2052148 RepID=A0A9D5K8R5_UNCW3|nr:50S ribosomal protein L10 [candidate division WOR-3 bacterium]MBD3364441.1 50S ribosomal protein L10 [candidate division WOR-3 bacterium]